jgi:tRNA(Arg) A34 adenosine deaminase TadA
MTYPPWTLTLPDWVSSAAPAGERHATQESRMALVVALARENVERGTGGPFGAAVFERESGRLIAPGVNLVVPAGCAIAHAEIVAIAFAQRALGTFDLGAEGIPACELVTSTEPCAMCLGAVPWSGVQSLVCGARKRDAVQAGFDEGERPVAWVAALRRRGIAVRRGVLRAEASEILHRYAADGGLIYNGRGG